MSILATLVLLAVSMGVATAGHAHTEGRLKPIGREETRSICASLCLAGLGGEPCGAPCATLTPRNQTQSDGGSAPSGTLAAGAIKTRRDACPLLCEYRLGDPLCDCNEGRTTAAIKSGNYPAIDYHRICGYFCSEHNYHIYGCPLCGVYRMQDLDRRVRPTEMDIDWEEWCREQCSIGMGGVACDCDLPLPLPMNLISQDRSLKSSEEDTTDASEV
ncbi:uncharacterized protein [Atheta coriaria]|uniref:uncharacterized protein n=1 Tax=Dalotia coriaria TaxID=877792 RepID=UPI0031F3BD4B